MHRIKFKTPRGGAKLATIGQTNAYAKRIKAATKKFSRHVK